MMKWLILTNDHYSFAIQHGGCHLIMLYLIISYDFNVTWTNIETPEVDLGTISKRVEDSNPL